MNEWVCRSFQPLSMYLQETRWTRRRPKSGHSKCNSTNLRSIENDGEIIAECSMSVIWNMWDQLIMRLALIDLILSRPSSSCLQTGLPMDSLMGDFCLLSQLEKNLAFSWFRWTSPSFLIPRRRSWPRHTRLRGLIWKRASLRRNCSIIRSHKRPFKECLWSRWSWSSCWMSVKEWTSDDPMNVRRHSYDLVALCLFHWWGLAKYVSWHEHHVVAFVLPLSCFCCCCCYISMIRGKRAERWIGWEGYRERRSLFWLLNPSVKISHISFAASVANSQAVDTCLSLIWCQLAWVSPLSQSIELFHWPTIGPNKRGPTSPSARFMSCTSIKFIELEELFPWSSRRISIA